MRHMKWVIVVLGVVIAGTAAAAQLEVSLGPVVDEAVLSSAEAGLLEFSVTNPTDEAVSFVRYTTPLGGFENDLFVVLRDGERLPYIGRLALRLGPLPENWVELGPGESVTGVIDLAEGYDLRRGGAYSITFRFPMLTRSLQTPVDEESAKLGGPDLGTAPALVESNTLDVLVDGPEAVEDLPLPFVAKAYSGCTTSQQSSLSTARSYGRSLSAKSYNQLAGTAGSSNSLYRTWFGAYTSSRYSFVRGGYYDLYYAFGRTWNYTCTSCEAGVIAYVYPTYAYNVWICPGFFGYSSTQRGSFLLHEASHWNAVIGTDDYGYGASYCQSLARTNPAAAVWNADNYRYFSLYAP